MICFLQSLNKRPSVVNISQPVSRRIDAPREILRTKKVCFFMDSSLRAPRKIPIPRDGDRRDSLPGQGDFEAVNPCRVIFRGTLNQPQFYSISRISGCASVLLLAARRKEMKQIGQAGATGLVAMAVWQAGRDHRAPVLLRPLVRASKGQSAERLLQPPPASTHALS
jgi:hypothetical protein